MYMMTLLVLSLSVRLSSPALLTRVSWELREERPTRCDYGLEGEDGRVP